MRKIIAVIFSLVLVLGLTGCGEKEQVVAGTSFIVPDGWEEVRASYENQALVTYSPDKEAGKYNLYSTSVEVHILKEDDLDGMDAKIKMDESIKLIEELSVDSYYAYSDFEIKDKTINDINGKVLSWKEVDPELKVSQELFSKAFIFTHNGGFYSFSVSAEKGSEANKVFNKLIKSIKFE